MIGDSLSSDMTGAVNSGLISCFLDRKDTGDTRGLKVDYIVKKPTDIFKIL